MKKLLALFLACLMLCTVVPLGAIIHAANNNLLVNGDFETGDLTGWGETSSSVVTITEEAAKDGRYGAHLHGGTWSGLAAFVEVEPNTQYALSYDYNQTASDSYGVYIKPEDQSSHLAAAYPSGAAGEWHTQTVTFNSQNETTIFVQICTGENREQFVDNVRLTKTGPDEPDEPEVETYEYLQLEGVQGWTQEHLNNSSANNGHESNVTATYYLSDQQLVGAAKQSIKAVKSSSSASFNCLVNKAYGTNNITAPTPWAPADGVSKVSEYDGVMIAVRDQNGKLPSISGVQLRVLLNPGSNGWGTYDVSTNYTFTDDGYMKFAFSDFPNEASVRNNIDTALGISFLLYSSGVTEYYFSDFKAYRAVKGVDFSALEQAIEELTALNTDGSYTEILNKARNILENEEATQEVVDQQTKELRLILRPLLLPEVNFDEDNIVVSFGAVSDIHITGSTTSSATKKYKSALQQLKAQAGGKLDAITIAGDFSSDSYSSSIGTAFKTITNSVLGNNANVFFISGNHDAQTSDWSTLSKFYSDLATYTKDDLASSQLDRGNRHKVINGYHYIGVNMMDYWNAQEAKFETRDLEWLGKELAAARADAPGKPIFVYVHAGVYGTTYGSSLYTGTYWGSKAIYSYLKDYPEVVTFSGHVHYPLMDERTIWQEDFTSLNCGSVQYMAIDNGYLQTGSKTTVSESHSVSSGLLVQVDKNNNLKITRMNFAAGEVIKEPFYISAPDLENETNLLHYNDDYFNLYNTAPTFPIGAMVTGSISGTNINVSFDAAIDDDMVHHYLLEIKDMATGTMQSTKIYSEFYLYSNTDQMPTNYSFNVPYSGSKDFNLTLYAVDSMGLKSKPITFESTAPAFDGYIYNGGFESGSLTKWTTSSASSTYLSTVPHSGSYSAAIKGPGNLDGGLLTQQITLEAGKTYTLSFWYKPITNGVNYTLRTTDGATNFDTLYLDSRKVADWTYHEVTFEAGLATEIELTFSGSGKGGTDEVLIDDVRLVNLSGSEMDRNPVLQEGGFSISDEVQGLAFLFHLDVTGAGVMEGTHQMVNNQGAIKLYKYAEVYGTLVRAGAILTNSATVGTTAFTAADVNGQNVIDVNAKYLFEVGENSISYAVRIINIPNACLSKEVYARPYFVYELEGEQVTIYGDVVSNSYTGVEATAAPSGY